MAKRTCTFKGCGDKHRAHGLCQKHYMRLWTHGTAEDPRPSAEERYWSKVDIRGPDDCWPWRAGSGPDGYGRFHFEGKSAVVAHRVGWMLTNGPIPDGLKVCHSCDNPPCQNPAHWWLGTTADNNADRSAKGRTARSQQTACHRGHPFEGYNLIILPNGSRRCRTCFKERRLARARRLAESRP